MKNFLAGSIFAVLMAAFFLTFQNTEVSDSGTRAPASDAGYCIALRGNGEAEPAHWGALARTVEQWGLPRAMAGGSSASVSMFLMEAIATHPLVVNQPVEIQKERASLLIKSMMGFFGELQKTKTWKDVQRFYGLFQSVESTKTLMAALTHIESKDFKAAKGVLERGADLGLLDMSSLQPLWAALKSADVTRAKFYVGEMLQGIQVLGKFNAATDDNLFFRAGIVNFDKAAESFGRIAAFYATAGEQPGQAPMWKKFIDQCAPGSMNLSWPEIIAARPKCEKLFHDLFVQHYADEDSRFHYEDRPIGLTMKIYPATAVLRDSAAREYREAMVRYHQSLDAHFGKDFHLSRPEDIRFGYWGEPSDLQRISRALPAGDEKSRRFWPLGPTTWRQVLSLSPAEPGLSPLKEFKAADGEEYFSAGGWSDLHPVTVLKAAGCEKVVYLTRTGGDSIFAQGVAKRLLNFDRDWSKLASGSDTVKELNNAGDPEDQTSLWSKLFNLGNPRSSYSRALADADAILCTNWDEYPVQSQFSKLIDDSYRSSYWINPKSVSFMQDLHPILAEKRSGCF